MVLKICIDTNVFIAVMNKEPNSLYCEMIFDAIDKNLLEPIISTIVVAEVLVGFNQDDENEKKKQFLQLLKIKYQIAPVSLEIAESGADFRSSSKIKLPDALIYATAIESKADVLISNDHPLAKKAEIPILTPTEFVEKYKTQLQ